MSDIPYLFKDGEEVIQTATWYSYLSSSPQIYKDCVVKSLTHVKNLRSDFVHEYLQVVIERTDTGARTRVVAERQETQDQVIIGKWGWTKSSFSSRGLTALRNIGGKNRGDLPLPLYSLKFKSHSFKVIDLAEILKDTTKAGGKYSILRRKHCYWFAFTAYTTIKKAFACIEQPWAFASWRGRFIIFKDDAEGEAKKFLELLKKGGMEYVGKPVPNRKFFEAVYKDAILLDADNEDSAAKKIKNDLDLLVSDDMENQVTFSALTQGDSKTPVEHYDSLDIGKLYETVSKDSESIRYRQMYDQFDQANPVETMLSQNHMEEPIIARDLVAVVPAQFQNVNDIVKVMAGYVLAEYQKNHPNSMSHMATEA